LEAENAALRAQVAEVAALRAQVQELLAQNQQLQARLATATKDSHNSSKPPSSDPLGRKRPRSQRRRSGKKPGGQLGHRGETRHLVATPDELVEHRPAVCTTCQVPLDETAPVVGYERRQVRELPPVRLQIHEHRALHVRCPRCEQVSVGSFPVEAPSRAQYGPRLRALAVYLVEQQLVPYARVRELLADLLGAFVSLGTLTRWVQQGAETLRPVEDAIKAALHRAPVLHSDETGVRRAGKLAWAHVASTARLTHDAIHPQRGREATDAIGILPGYGGVSVHDGWKPYRHYVRHVTHFRIPRNAERTGRMFSGSMAYLMSKGKGKTSMPLKRREAKALYAKRRRKARAIRSELDCPNPSLQGRNDTSTGRTLENGTAPFAWCGVVGHATPKEQPMAMSH